MDYFKKAVGQQSVKDTLNFYLDSYKQTSVIDPLLFVAPKGVGKTFFCHQLGAALNKDMDEIHGGTIKNKDQFINQILFNLVDKKRTLFIDEFHAVPPAVAELFLTLFNGIGVDEGRLNYEEQKIVIDFKKVSFLFATTEKDKIFSPLLDRLSIITFNEYKYDEIAKIIQLNTNKVKIESMALEALAPYCRGNARSAERMGRYVFKYAGVKGIDEFKFNDIKELTRMLNLYPLGLNSQEVIILKYIKEAHNKGISLNSLCSKTGLDTQPQRSMERYLLKHGLMDIDVKRKITLKGLEYLESLEA